MTTISNGESGLSVRNKLNVVLEWHDRNGYATLAETTFNTDAAFIAADLTAYPDGTIVRAEDALHIKVTGALATSAASIKNDWEYVSFPTVAGLIASVQTMTEGDVKRADDYRYDVAASGATDQHITTAGGAKLYVLPDSMGYNVRAFGSVGTSDDGVIFQTVADAAEAAGVPFHIPSGTVINLNRTVYLGDLSLSWAGSTINVVIDANFTKQGGAFRAKAGAILTKSATGSTYASSPVSIFFDEINITVTRSVDYDITGTNTNDGKASVKSGMILEDTNAFKGRSFTQKVITTGYEGWNTGGLDLWGGVQGVRISDFSDNTQNPNGIEGFWIRNGKTTRATRDVVIDNLYFTGAHDDEMVAVFNFAGSGESDAVLGSQIIIEDIHLGLITFDGVTDSGNQVLSVFNNGDYSEGNFRNITVGKISGRFNGALSTNLNGTPKRSFIPLRVAKCSPHFNVIDVEFDATWDETILQFAWIMRFEKGTGQTDRPRVDDARIKISSNNTPPSYDITNNAYIVDGEWDIDNLHILGSGDGWGWAVNEATVQRGAVDGGPFNQWAVRDSNFIGCDISGRMSGVSVFTGVHTCDVTKYPSTIFFLHPSNTPSSHVKYAPKSVVAIGSGTMLSVLGVQKTSGQLIVDVEYEVDFPSGITIGSDSFTPECAPVNYKASQRNNGDVSSIRGKTKFISAGVITVTHPWHPVDNEASASTDDLITINGVQKFSTVRIEGVSTNRTTNVLTTGNVTLNREFALQGPGSSLTLYNDGTTLREISRSEPRIRQAFSSGPSLEIDASGLLSGIIKDYHVVSSNGGSGADTLTNLQAPMFDGQVFKMLVESGSTITVDHAGGNIRCNSASSTAYSSNSLVTFFGFAAGGLWIVED